jgi:hypothetical protein
MRLSLESDAGDRVSTLLKASDIKRIIKAQTGPESEKLTWSDDKAGLLFKHLMSIDESLSMDDVSFIKIDGFNLLKQNGE